MRATARRVVLEDVSFSVPSGARLSILGRNGMGKTTLLSTLMGMNRRYGGEIRLGGADVSRARRARSAHDRGIGSCRRRADIFRSLTVEENLVVGLKDRPRSVVQEAYDMFPRLHERREQSRLAIVRRRAADALHRPHHSRPPVRAAPRRAAGRAGARHLRGADGRLHAARLDRRDDDPSRRAAPRKRPGFRRIRF